MRICQEMCECIVERILNAEDQNAEVSINSLLFDRKIDV